MFVLHARVVVSARLTKRKYERLNMNQSKPRGPVSDSPANKNADWSVARGRHE